MKTCTKSQLIIHMAMCDNTHNKLYQLKLNNIDYHVICHTEFDANTTRKLQSNNTIQRWFDLEAAIVALLKAFNDGS